LGFVRRMKLRNSLQFQHNLLVYDEIRHVLPNKRPFVFDCQRRLAFERNVSQRKFLRQRSLVYRLQKAWTQHSMHFHRRANDGVRQLLEQYLGHQPLEESLATNCFLFVKLVKFVAMYSLDAVRAKLPGFLCYELHE